ncbi:MAG TPA: flagellar export chaperone FliS [Ruminiclostridium sp.]|nr:flagellar export chaperone FliS [Ruminiclostridium sp.]
MIASQAYNQYKENFINTASPEELTLMLYNGLIKFIMRGIDCIDKQNVQETHNNIVKAQNIIAEFSNTLDMRYEISNSLGSIYEYIYSRLVDANISKDKKILEEVLELAKTLRDTWEQAVKITRKKIKSPEATSAI